MNRHLYVWLVRLQSFNGSLKYHIHFHSHRFRQIHLDSRLWVFRQNKNHVFHCLLSEDWSRRLCHQYAKMLWKNKALQKYMEDLNKEYQTLDQRLQNISVNEGDQRTLNQRHAELAPLVAIYQEIQRAEEAIEELESLCKSLNKQDDKQLQELALEEKQTIDQKINMLCSELFQSLVPKEKYDKNDVILEVTSGRTTGGDICQQFTREIFDMYQNYSCYKHWTFQILNYTPADYGGLHHAAARISGDNVYKYLKYEGGIHRVQRIPEVGLSSRMQRIHTGTMSVIVLPQPDEVGTRAQSERIRTYNFTQDRVTDHRIACEVRDIKEFLCGEKCLDQLIQRLLQSADEEAIIELLDKNLKSAK
ncbi:peptide chain release factor 1, mitochondrial isoform X3 [Tupaia chinensis]|uniref:peptide chain release factor 1, mitochondrial isoform X3 n=1 Tax=Tupaia chinensis TaxID=246437 RepID=UPI000704063A|nr:peptide chain release factor 1, mitochondrial isoform X3 [Tupaia chinensis]